MTVSLNDAGSGVDGTLPKYLGASDVQSSTASSVLEKKTTELQRGGAKSGGGGARPHEETPHGKQFPTPLTSVRFAPPHSISLSESLRNSRISLR